jgi:FAD/FMN-containing dehydrogenase
MNAKEFALRALAEALPEKVLTSDDPGYQQARALWNGAIKHEPIAMIMVEAVEDIQTVMAIVDKYGLTVSVKGGGHDWAGRALNNEGVVIDMQGMKEIDIDLVNQLAIVQGGVIGKELLSAAELFNLVAIVGTVGAVGFAGFTLGGGYGLLSPSYGLSVDNLLSAQVVLFDGTLVTASKEEHADLFWALKGGGGNFGVVVSLTVRLHTIQPFLAGLMLFPWEQAEQVLTGYAAMMLDAPDTLSVLAGLIPAPDGSPILFLIPTWYGDAATGELQMDLIRALGTPFVSQVTPMKFSDLLGIFDPYIAKGRHYAIQTRWLPDLKKDAITAIMQAAGERSSMFSSINIHHFHGASTRVALPDTAFGLRNPHFMLEIISAWEPGEPATGQKHYDWARNLSQLLAEHAFAGGYANILGPDEHEQIGRAYGINLSRLQQIKTLYDPNGTFSGITIPGEA